MKYTETIKELIETTHEQEILLNKNQRVHSETNLDYSNRTLLRVKVPKPYVSDLKKERILGWAYWIGVGEESREAYKKNVEAIGGLAQGIASTYASPLAGLVVGSMKDLVIPTLGEDVGYYFIRDYPNAELFLKGQEFYQFDMGKGVAAFSKHTDPKEGTFYIGLHNDNFRQGIDVEVKVIVVKEVSIYQYVDYEREKEEPIKVELNKKRLEVKETKYRVPVE